MIPDKKTREAWRNLANNQSNITSALGEYTPLEFIQVLDALEEVLGRKNEKSKCNIFKLGEELYEDDPLAMEEFPED